MSIGTWTRILKGVIERVDELNPGSGQVHNYDELPATIMTFPTAIIVPRDPGIELGASLGAIEHYQVDVTVFVAGSLLPEAMANAIDLIEPMANALAGNVTLDGQVSYCLPAAWPERWVEGPGGIEYGSVRCTAIRFRLRVKTQRSLTVS